MIGDAQFKNEAAFTRWTLKIARERDWLAAHLETHRIVRRPGGETRAIPDADATGFPDVVAIHGDHGLLVAELKMPGRKPTIEQLVWLRLLRAVGIATWVWYPKDVDEIVDVFDGKLPSTRLQLRQITRIG